MLALQEYFDVDEAQEENPMQAAHALTASFGNTKLSQLENLEQKLREHKGHLLGCEELVARKIDSFLEILARRVNALKVLSKKYPDLASKYGYFDYKAALKWRDNKEYPSLAVYELGSHAMTFAPINSYCRTTERVRKVAGCMDTYLLNGKPTVRIPKEDGYGKEAYGSLEINPILPLPIFDCFADMGQVLCGKGFKLTSRFSGLIPSDIRPKIVEAKSDFGADIFILAEAQWEEKVELPNPDPIVIGFKHGYAWLITTFDLTTLEAEMVKGLSAPLLNS